MEAISMVFLFFLFFQLVVVLRSQLVITLLFLILFCFVFFWGGGLFIFNWTCIMKNYVTEINRISLRPIRSNYFTKLRNNHELKCLLWELTYLNPIYNLHYGKSNLVHWFKPLFELCCMFSGSTVFIRVNGNWKQGLGNEGKTMFTVFRLIQYTF